MVQDAESFLVPFLGALQASIAVLLTIAVGVVAAQFGLLSETSSKEISKFCVRISLPALLIVNVGSQLQLDTAIRYVPILIWAVFYNVTSMLFGFAVTKTFKLPDWTTAAIAFNNTTSLPLLLVQSLDATGILDSINPGGDAIKRAQSYFLVNAIIGNSLTFALGPGLLNGHEEDAPDQDDEKDEDDADGHIEAQEQEAEREAEQANEDTSLLPNRIVRGYTRAEYAAYNWSKGYFRHLPPWSRHVLVFLYQFANPAVIGAAIGALVGLVPALHRLFFDNQESGGYLNAWLTSAINNVGGLFATLQVIVVGVKLSRALMNMKKGDDSGNVPWRPMVLIIFIRFIVWPAISIPAIFYLATKTGVLADDPILWFCMMLMPTGPPALKLTALADVTGASDEEKMSIAKFLTISYFLSPLISFSVLGALKASEAAVGS